MAIDVSAAEHTGRARTPRSAHRRGAPGHGPQSELAHGAPGAGPTREWRPPSSTRDAYAQTQTPPPCEKAGSEGQARHLEAGRAGGVSDGRGTGRVGTPQRLAGRGLGERLVNRTLNQHHSKFSILHQRPLSLQRLSQNL